MTDVLRETEIISKQDPNSRPIKFIEYKDGAIAFGTDSAETFVYLYADEVKQLKKLLRKQKSPVVDNLANGEKK
jgi:hypothetical protein